MQLISYLIQAETSFCPCMRKAPLRANSVFFYLVVHNHRWIFIFFTGGGAITLFSAL